MKKHFTLQNSAFNWNDSDLCNLSSGRSFLNIKLKEKNELLCQDKDWKPFAFKKPYYIIKFGTLVEYSLRST